MLGWSLRHRDDELLGHPVSPATYVETGEPTGVALLHPWANRLASPRYEIAGRRVELDIGAPNVHTDRHGLPIHGLVAGSPRWELLEERRATLKARLDYARWPELAAGFPFPHVLELAARLSDRGLELDVELAVTGDVPVPVAFGFHPYLTLPGLDRRRWLVELPVTSRMVLDERMLPTGESEPVRIPPAPLGDRTFDDAYTGIGGDFVLRGGGRRIAVTFESGYPYAQVYAPEGEPLICFEPMTAATNALVAGTAQTLDAGGSFAAAFRIEVTDD